jgi:predicted negative regulator of RcsB-dependent stress response
MMEARLRLGRLLYRRGDLDKAAQQLDAARQLAFRDELRYLALVFRGRVEAARGNYARADAL